MDILLVDEALLGDNLKGLLRAILKLRPETGVVVLCEKPEHTAVGLNDQVIFLAGDQSQSRILTAMIEAKSLSMKRSAST